MSSEQFSPGQGGNGHQPILSIRQVHRVFKQGEREIRVLDGASADIYPGQLVALVGPSGAGKSTFLHVAGLLEQPDGGDVDISGLACAKMNDTDRTNVRRSEIGFVYQFHQLLPEFSALENVVIPQMIFGKKKRDAEQRAQELLGFLGLTERLQHRPAELSGGEQQRTAICRALANSPRLLLADEPTGNLDPKTSERVFEALVNVIRTTGVAAVIATHDFALAGRMDRVLRLEDGHLHEMSPAQFS